MYFKKIKMHGFKSFAEPVNIEFDRGITCIVGPNGSGKSNISDAIRWVLGEQSPKMLRGGKMEEVIFAGTSSRKSRGMAEVTLVIDNEDGSLPIDYKEVAITRRMFRSGESEYHINGNQCRLRDIRELIMDTGIGVDGYSIIGQGKISEILSSRTESRREIFEEAAGIVMYRTKKAEAERKLESTSANMERVRDIIGEIEGRIDGLREESIRAKEYIGLRDRYKELEINIILKNIENTESKNIYIKEDLEELQRKLDDTRKVRRETEMQLSSCSARSEELEMLSADTQAKLMTAVDELNRVVNRSHVDRERLSAIDENIDRLETDIRSLSEKLNNEKQNAESAEATRDDAEKRLAEARHVLEERAADYEVISEMMDSLMEQADRFKNEIFEKTSQVSSARAEISSISMMCETLERRQKTLLAERDTGTDRNNEILDRLNKIRQEKEELEDILSGLREGITEKNRQAGESRNREKELSSALEELKITMGQLSARKKTIEEMESNYEGYNNAVRFIMKSDLGGIHGVVADLVKVPEGYETAMETALGAALQNIVCDDDNSAKKAVMALKASRAGRLTFLPVSSVRGRCQRDGRFTGMPGFIGFGPDCLEYSAEYGRIVDHLLGRVIIVDSMDNAVRMSKNSGGYRFVTLEGEVINAGGAITGGRYRNKTANILDRKAEIASMAGQLRAYSARRDKCAAELEAAGRKASELVSQLEALRMQMSETERKLNNLKSEGELEEKMLREIRSGGDRLSRELQSIKAEQEASEVSTARLRSIIAEAEKAIEEAERLSTEKLNEYDLKKDEYDRMSEVITAARIDVGSCQRDMEHASDMAARISTSVDEITRDLGSRRRQLREITEEKAAILQNERQNSISADEKQEEKKQLEAVLSDIAAEKADLSGRNSTLTAEKEAADSRIESMQSQKYELEIKNAKNETQLDTYKNKLWEDFEISYIQAMDFRSEDFVMSSAVKENRAIKSRMKELGDVNTGSIEEYETVRERYEFLTSQQADIQAAVDDLNRLIEDLDKTIKTRFKESFDTIVVNFEEKFRELFGGGHAELRLSDQNDPLGSSIDIVAQPPGKKLQNINLLSGGEKTLTAIALMFAVLKAKPTPFCILDEVEAALDDANIDRFINCLRKLTGIQFALVTHQKATMEHADAIFGVTMPEKGISKVLSLSMADDFEI